MKGSHLRVCKRAHFELIKSYQKILGLDIRIPRQ